MSLRYGLRYLPILFCALTNFVYMSVEASVFQFQSNCVNMEIANLFRSWEMQKELLVW